MNEKPKSVTKVTYRAHFDTSSIEVEAPEVDIEIHQMMKCRKPTRVLETRQGVIRTRKCVEGHMFKTQETATTLVYTKPIARRKKANPSE